MNDARFPPDEPPDSDGTSGSTSERPREDGDGDDGRDSESSLEEAYDFESFGPSEMADMSAEEWDTAFDPESWITGPELLARVERDLKQRIADRDVFAVLERIEEGGDARLLAYSDEGYAIVYPDGSVEGSGTVLRDVKPTVALCSMDGYEVSDPPEDWGLPSPEEVPAGSGDLGNKMLQVLAFGLLVSGLALIVGPFTLLSPADGGGALIVPIIIGLGFIAGSVLLFLVVANARLSDRFRAVEYRDRLRAAGVESDERPAFVPVEDGEIRPIEGRDETNRPP